MILLDIFSKNTLIPNLMKILPLEVELFHADRGMDGRTDMIKLIAASRNFAYAPNNGTKTSNTYLSVKSIFYSIRKIFKIFSINTAIIINYKN